MLKKVKLQYSVRVTDVEFFDELIITMYAAVECKEKYCYSIVMFSLWNHQKYVYESLTLDNGKDNGFCTVVDTC